MRIHTPAQQGLGRGILGIATQPMSGVLDFVSSTTEGLSARQDNTFLSLLCISDPFSDLTYRPLVDKQLNIESVTRILDEVLVETLSNTD